MAFTFKGGIHIAEHKETGSVPIEKMKAPKRVAIPLLQHIGAPAKAVVNKGDKVLAGQVIGRNEELLCCPVHASISGTVVDIEARNNYGGMGKAEYIIIENDASENQYHFSGITGEITLDKVVGAVREAGISGMGGATFPTYAKIQSAVGKVKEIIINCAECEPYITANHRLMLEDAESIISGAKMLMKALDVSSTVIAIEDNKKDAIKHINGIIGESDGIKVATLKTKYPQGDERQLMYALHKAELPKGKLPADMGYVIFNAETCSAISYAVKEGRPLIKRIVTVSGDCIKEPKNLLVPIGTSIKDVIEYCGGFKSEPEKIICGGPMMGTAQWDINAPVTKGTSAILAICKTPGAQKPSCIHCGKCVRACPMHLMPSYLALFSSNDRLDMCEKYGCMSCVECGCCTYICPAGVPIVQHIRKAKSQIAENSKKQRK